MKSRSVIDAILAHHRCAAEWHECPATGVANRIVATQTVVLRIATNHPVAIPDARTESVAAPVARAAGILVPELIAFDDSCLLIDRPYSIWERIHGETLGLWAPDARTAPQTWRAVGREVARLHDLHPMNIMCSRDDDLLALIDWGDAGWGDPMLDLSPVPLAAVPLVLAGYRDETEPLDEAAEARIVWDRIRAAIRSLEKDASRSLELEELTRFIGTTQLASLV